MPSVENSIVAVLRFNLVADVAATFAAACARIALGLGGGSLGHLGDLVCGGLVFLLLNLATLGESCLLLEFGLSSEVFAF